MSYTQWFEEHAVKHKKLMQKLLSKGLARDEIIAYFDFENMVKKEPDFCPLYKELNEQSEMGKKCHDMTSLNCYLCACPNFRFSDEGFEKREDKRVYSYCAIESKDGRQGVYGDAIHQDCSKCSVPHHVSYVKKHYDEDWKTIMKACQT
ncbi:MAG: hypothetical protein U9Q62_12535 [Campylobacterota bacterium]|nr:hypothetical protein [Campylobacterota bacterium]